MSQLFDVNLIIKRLFLAAMLICMLLLVPATGSAQLTSYSSRASFEAVGSVAEKYGFEDLGQFATPGTAHGITYPPPGPSNYGDSVVTPSGGFYAPISNVLTTGWYGSLSGIIDAAPQYNMFGVDMAYIGDYDSDMNFRLFTNRAEYLFYPASLPNVDQAQTFFGWTLDDGEYFTGFAFGSQHGNRNSPTMDNVTLGHTGNLPVPILSCSPAGFLPPFDIAIALKIKQQRAIPIKMMLQDNTGAVVTDFTIAAPVVNVEYYANDGTGEGVTSEPIPLGASNDDNIFRFDPATLTWIYDFSTKFFEAPGTYKVTARAGDANYSIDASCTGTFVRLP